MRWSRLAKSSRRRQVRPVELPCPACQQTLLALTADRRRQRTDMMGGRQSRYKTRKTREEARQDVFDDIEMFYKPVRKPPSGMGYRHPSGLNDGRF